MAEATPRTDAAAPTYRLLTRADIPGAQRLRELAHWNQTDRDWEHLLDFEPQGCFAAEYAGQLAGTATTTRFLPAAGAGSFGWVGMVLVDPGIRRMGIGSTLLKRCIAYLEGAGVETVRLDATPMGKKVYDQLGFADEYSLERWEGTARGTFPAASVCTVEALTAERLDGVAAWDREVFGADRMRVLAAWRADWPECAVAAYAGGRLAGYALARRGSRFQQIGPIVAASPVVAEGLLQALLHRLSGQPVIVDFVTSNAWTAELLARSGLAQQRPFIRMAKGPNRSPGNPAPILAIACPELG
ncbi:MAG: GNAT family N-acetyltransferase [Planctomycetes bacterium]|nr:GNAT family N-acetyltransferase [Planctomycetota bacterium]